MKLRLAIILSIILCLSAVAKESNSDSIVVKYTFNPIVKIATKTAGAQRDLAASISILESTDIEQAGTVQVFELVGHLVPGLYVTEWGMMGFGVAGKAAGKISIRGMGGGANTHVLILRNGRPDFMGLMGCTIADEFNTSGVERIEIIRGPGSFLYGTNATGGVINIVSKKMHQPGFETHMQAGGGSFGSQQFSLNHGGKIGALDYYVTVSRNLTDGHRSDGNASYRGNHYSSHVGYAVNSNTQIDFNTTLTDITLYDPGLISSPSDTNEYNMMRYGGDLTVTHFGGLGETNVKFHGNFGQHDFFDGWKSDDRLLGVMAYQTMHPWTGHTMTVGFDWKEYGGDARDLSQDYLPYYLTEYAPYAHLQQLIGKRLIFAGGLRLEHHELYGWETLPKAGLVAHASNSNSVRLSAAKGFRSPSIRELYFWNPANDLLQPDRVWNYELGITQEIGHQLKIEAAVFESRGSNLIQFSGPPARKWVNSGDYSVQGIEVTGSWMLNNSFHLNAAYTWMDLDEQAYNIPRQKLSLNGRYRVGKMVFSGQLQHIQDWKSAEFSGPSPVPVLHDMKNYSVVHFAMDASLISGLHFKLMLKNAFDAKYQALYGYPMPGRTFHGAFSYDF